MIWYLLFPLRGTTEAPVLPPSHPLRSTFTRYGRYAARHVVATLLVSAAVATSLIYPIPFLFTNDFINGASNLPHHVWTVAQPLAYDSTVEPDIIMRSIWVHASYMQALNTELLSSALDLQDELLGVAPDRNPNQVAGFHDTDRHVNDHDPQFGLSLAQRDALHIVNGLNNQSWFFHSPLLYWNCSHQRILDDQDIVGTVNDKKNQSTSVNVTLRHSIVFSGKRFEDRRLMSADAVVITLLHLRDSPVGRQWETRAIDLAAKVSDKWDVYPYDGHVSSSQLYDFQFRPISMQDSLILALAYGLSALYFMLSLSKLRAVKSKVGLIVTVVTQIAFTIMASFTVCAVFNIDLSRIPRAAYPLAILAMSLENIFRLINAVILTPSDHNTSNRIGHAFGATGHTALVSTLQNVVILFGLSRLVSPGVSAFCIFAAVAICFDFFFLSTFFLAVLSVDVRRTELSDALAKTSMRHERGMPDNRDRPSWLWQVLHGKTAMSTRIAGTIIMVGFVLIAQWHFFDEDSVFKSFLRLWRGGEPPRSVGNKTSLLKDINQARSPTSWLRLQDHETAREVINIIKPSSYSYIARVYEPLVFVLKGSDRIPDTKELRLLPAAYDFVHHQLTRFLVFVVVVVAALRLLTNYLLWEDEAAMGDDDGADPEPLLSVTSWNTGHVLDVVMLVNAPNGQLVSVGLDRGIRVWHIRSRGSSYAITDTPDSSPFPVLAIAIDDDSKWLALLSPSRISLWDLVGRMWARSIAVDNFGQRPESFFFLPCESPTIHPGLVIVQRNGTLREIKTDLKSHGDNFAISSSPLACARPLITKGDDSASSDLLVYVATGSRKGEVQISARKRGSWTSRSVSIPGLQDTDTIQIVPLPLLSLFLVASPNCVYLVGVDGNVIHSISTNERIQPRTLQCAHSIHRSSQPGAIGLTMLTLCYTGAQSTSCTLQSFAPREDSEAIWLRAPPQLSASSGWCTWRGARLTTKHIDDAGVWTVLSDGSAVGIRQRASPGYNDQGTTKGDATETVRHRFASQKKRAESSERWEVWTASAGGCADADETQPLFQDAEQTGHLLISELGPRVKVGLMSAAFSFGNVIKLVTVGGHERFEGETEETGRGMLVKVSGRRRRPGWAPRPRAWS